jgi:antitoxin (DNA-binding transcriptional repressor) of toxin-antitoxin stability system
MDEPMVHEAGEEIGPLLAVLQGGRPVIITAGGFPVARLVPYFAGMATGGSFAEELDDPAFDVALEEAFGGSIPWEDAG